MNLPNHAGRYLANPVQYGVQPSDDPTKHGVAWVCLYDLAFYFDRASGEWVDVSQDGLQLTGYHYVIKNDGQPNTTQINQLKSSLGWDGRSISGLEGDGFKSKQVQIQVDSELYNGKTKWKVNWIDPADAEPTGGGGVRRAEPAVVQSLDAKYGSMLRALNGPAAPAKPATPPPAAKPAQAPQINPVEQARKSTWEAFKRANPDKNNDDLLEPWRATIKEVISDRQSNTFSSADWQKVQEHIERPANPIGDEPHFLESEIPF